MSAITINTNFIFDFVKYCQKELTRLGINFPLNVTHEETIRVYYNVLFKLISATPRNILVSTEFVCPPAYISGLKILEQKIRNGTNLIPHLSLGIKNTNLSKKNTYDSMLNDWGIYHLHLGIRPYKKDPNFIERTQSVLFAVFDNENAYFIGVYNHGKGYFPWIKLDIMNIISSNWPFLLNQVNGVNGDVLNEENIRSLRSKNANYLLKINGDVIAPAGGGSMASGIGFNVLRKSDEVIANLISYETIIRQNAVTIANQIERQLHIQSLTTLNVQLCIKDNKCFLYEKNTDCIINTNEY